MASHLQAVAVFCAKCPVLALLLLVAVSSVSTAAVGHLDGLGFEDLAERESCRSGCAAGEMDGNSNASVTAAYEEMIREHLASTVNFVAIARESATQGMLLLMSLAGTLNKTGSTSSSSAKAPALPPTEKYPMLVHGFVILVATIYTTVAFLCNTCVSKKVAENEDEKNSLIVIGEDAFMDGADGMEGKSVAIGDINNASGQPNFRMYARQKSFL